MRVSEEPQGIEIPEEEVENARRDALKRLGIMTAYTAPALMMLMHSRAAASSSVSSGSTN
jgi:hypothetical protein